MLCAEIQASLLGAANLLLVPPTSHYHSINSEKLQWQKDLQVLRSCVQPLSLGFENKEPCPSFLSIPPIFPGFPLLVQGHFLTERQSKTSFPCISANTSEELNVSSVKWTCYPLIAREPALRSSQQCWGHGATQTQLVAAEVITAGTALLSSPAMLPKPSHFTESTEGNFTGFEQHTHSGNICWQNKPIYLRVRSRCWRLGSIKLTGLLRVRWSFWSVSSSEGSIFILIEEQL